MAKFPEKSKGDLHQRILGIKPLKLIAYSFLSIIGVISVYLLFIGPLIAKQAVKLTTIETEVFIGNKLSNNIFMTLDIDAEKSSQLMSFYHECNYKSKYPIQIYYSNSKVVNAFAIPGGKIVVFKGIIDEMESYEELAGLIGHELAHVEKRHSLIQIANQLSTYLLVSALTSDVSGISATILENSINFNHLKNSRDFEKEADLWALEQMKINKINQKGMSKLFERIMNENDNLGGSIVNLEFLSSHPLTSKRINYINKSITDSTDYQNKKRIAIFNEIKGN
jgi:Zn-dependent protease with chaperone function